MASKKKLRKKLKRLEKDYSLVCEENFQIRRQLDDQQSSFDSMSAAVLAMSGTIDRLTEGVHDEH